MTTKNEKILVGICVFLVMGLVFQMQTIQFDDTQTNNQNFLNPKVSQATTLSINDNMSRVWDGESIFKVEIGQALEISALWDDIINSSSLKIESFELNVWVDFATISADTSNSEYTNFTVLFDNSFNDGYGKRLTINADGNLSISQKYAPLSKSAPDRNENDEYIVNKINIEGSDAIFIDWADTFEDNVGIYYYKIARVEATSAMLANPINSDNFNTYVIDNVYGDSYIDDSITDETKYYYYAVRAYDYINYYSVDVFSFDLKLSIENIPPTLDSSNIYFQINSQSIDPASTVAPSGILKITILTDDDCVGGNITLTSSSAEIVPYEFALGLVGSNWVSPNINLANPRATGSPIQDGDYSIKIEVIDYMGNSNEYLIADFITIETPIEPTGPDPTMIIVIIVVSVVAIGTVLFIVKKKKDEETTTESDVEFNTGPAKKQRKGKIYSGASSIGRASGREADLLKKRRVDEPSTNLPKKSSKSVPTARSTEVRTTATPKAPISPKIPKSESDFEEILSDKPSAMKMKQAENTIETDRRLAFLDSKVDSLIQNLSLMNVILDQTGQIAQKTKECEQCGEDIPVEWNECAYCKVNGQETSIDISKPGIGQHMICPVCKNILEPEWTQCPFCIVDRK